MEDIRKGACPLCKHNEIVEAEALEFGDFNVASPKGVAYAVTRPQEMLGMTVAKGGAPSLPDVFGALVSYTCRRCGYTQWFAKDPAQIPIHPGNRTRLIKGQSSDGPYR
jgi:hypothetical protein